MKLHPRAVFTWKFQRRPTTVRVFSDTNYAGCLKTRKSTQGGAVLVGGRCVKTWSSTQAVIALSSGEAGCYGVVKGASVALGVRSMMKDLGCETMIKVLTDVSAAEGMASRRGLGHTRHIDVHYLWVQEKVANGEFILRKVSGVSNPADLCTKHMDSPKMQSLMQTFGFGFEQGRSSECPEIGHISVRPMKLHGNLDARMASHLR